MKYIIAIGAAVFTLTVYAFAENGGGTQEPWPVPVTGCTKYTFYSTPEKIQGCLCAYADNYWPAKDCSCPDGFNPDCNRIDNGFQPPFWRCECIKETATSKSNKKSGY